jgi:predicted alpha/beta-fold hydrolase
MLKATAVGSVVLFFSPLMDTKMKYYHHHESWVAKELIANCPTLAAGRFVPTPYLPHGGLQATYGIRDGAQKPYNEKHKLVDYERELITLPDGGTLSIDWHTKEVEDDANVVIILHGLTGGSHCLYIRYAVEKLGK